MTQDKLANYRSVCCKYNELPLNWQLLNTAAQLQLLHVT
jgi:hypothetical protein